MEGGLGISSYRRVEGAPEVVMVLRKLRCSFFFFLG